MSHAAQWILTKKYINIIILIMNIYIYIYSPLSAVGRVSFFLLLSCPLLLLIIMLCCLKVFFVFAV